VKIPGTWLWPTKQRRSIIEKISSIFSRSYRTSSDRTYSVVLEVAEEVPEIGLAYAVVLVGVDLIPGPLDRPLRLVVEPGGDEEGRLLVVPEDGVGELHGYLDAGPGVGPVPDDVPQTDDLRALLLLDVLQDRPEGLEVRVDIGDDGASTGHGHPHEVMSA
jgi:hypothetical protein